MSSRACIAAAVAAVASAATLFVSGGPEISVAVLLAVPQMAVISNSTVVNSPNFAAWNIDASVIFIASEVQRTTGFVASYGNTGKPDVPLQGISITGSNSVGTVHVAVHGSQSWVVSASYTGNSSAVYPVTSGGKLSPPTTVFSPGIFAHQVVFDPSDQFLFIPCLGSDYIAQYIFNGTSGQVTVNPAGVLPLPYGAGPRHLSFHPAALVGTPYAYAVAELSVELFQLAYTASTGSLSVVAAYRLLPPETPASNQTGAEVVLTPDGTKLYASVRGPPGQWNGIAAYSVNTDDGTLTSIGYFDGGGAINWPRSISVDPTGQWLAVGNEHANSVTLMTINGDGSLTVEQTTPVQTAPTFVGFLPF